MDQTEMKVQNTSEIKQTESKIEDNEEYDYITVPPDGGYGWVIVIACFIISMIIDGFLYAFGALSENLRQSFQCQEWTVSFLFALACGFYLLSAPITSALCNKWGCRLIGVLGSIISAIGIATSIFSPNIYIMWILFGVMGGIGMGLVYVPSIIMIGHYFEEKRALATNIVTIGTGIGAIAFGPLSNCLFNKFGWQNVFLMLSGVFLSCTFCCLTMRPLTPTRKQRIAPTPVEDYDIVCYGTMPSYTPDADTQPATISISQNSTTQDTSNHFSRVNSAISTKSRQSIKAEDAVRPLYKEDVLYQGDTRELPEYQSQPDMPTYIQQTTVIPDLVQKSPMKAFWDILLIMSNAKILKDKRILIVCLANVCSMIGYYVPYLFIVKGAIFERYILPANAVCLLSIIGLSHFIIRFTSGWITKIPYLSPLLLNNIGLFVAGIATILLPLCSTYTLLAIFCIVWGASIAFHVALSPVIVCQIVSLEQYSNALGLTLIFRDITVLITLPLMGAIRDLTSSVNFAFIIAGLSFILSALLYLCLTWMKRSEEPKVKATTSQGHTNVVALDI